MDKDLTPLDALKIALREEKKAHDFYTEWAKKVAGGSTQKMFEHLAAEEARHINIIEDEIDKVNPPTALEGLDRHITRMNDAVHKAVMYAESRGIPEDHPVFQKLKVASESCRDVRHAIDEELEKSQYEAESRLQLA